MKLVHYWPLGYQGLSWFGKLRAWDAIPHAIGKGVFSMKKGNTFTITMQGSTLVGTSKVTGVKKTGSKVRVKRKRKTQGREPYAECCQGLISRGVRRSKNHFAHTLGSIKNRPTYHISLNMPCRVDPDMEYAVLNSCLDDFFKRMVRLYPQAYFIRIYGWSPKAGLHAHVLARFGIKSSKQQKTRDVKKAWHKSVGSNLGHLVHMSKCSDGGTVGYLTSPKKDSEYRIAFQRAKGRRVWSIIGRKNIRSHKETVLVLTLAEHEVFKKILLKLLCKHGLVESNARQLEKEDYCLNYLTSELLKEAFKKFNKWRARHE